MKKPIHALLFDLDGTIIETGELHFQATVQTLETFGLSIDRTGYDIHIHGNNNSDIATFFFPDGNREKKAAYVDAKERLFRELLKPTQPIAGLPDILAWTKQHAIAVGLVTNAPAANTLAMLAALGLSGRFDPVILGDDLPRAKPDPLPFIVAMEKLGVRPENVIGFDDSGHGIQAVAAAGLYTVGVATSLRDDELVGHGADLVITDYQAPELLEILHRCAPAMGD